MSKTLEVLKNELITTVSRRSFVFTTFGIPLLSILTLMLVSALNRNAPDTLTALLGEPGLIQARGYVDASGLIRSLPPGMSGQRYLSFPDETMAQQALVGGEINAYYLISSDYLTSGEITLVRPDFNPFSAFDESDEMERLLAFNLLDEDLQLSARALDPVYLDKISLADEPQRDRDHPLSFFLPYAVTLLLYTVILMTSSYLLGSVTSEKENRVIEIVLGSIRPGQLLAGKILGLGVLGLLQMVLWAGTGYGLLRFSGRAFNLPPGFLLPPSIFVWGVVFFLLGYAVYASLMAGLGALVPNLREASQATFVIILPMIIPLLFIGVLIDDSQASLATGLSLFPLTAPVSMMTRLAAGRVPWWQPYLAAALLAVTAGVIVRAVARLFRAQILLSGQPFNLRRLLTALLGGD